MVATQDIVINAGRIGISDAVGTAGHSCPLRDVQASGADLAMSGNATMPTQMTELMRKVLALLSTLLPGIVCTSLASAAESSTDDRLSFSVDGSTLSDSGNGGGASLGWLHNFNADSIVGLGAEYQGIANTHWTFGTLSGSTTRATSNGKLSIYGEVQKGAGDFGAQGFDYSVVDAGVIRTFNQKFSLQVEDRQIDIFTTHGNLPQIQAAARWNPRWLTTVAYAHSVSGNLGTDLGSMRIDRYMPTINLFAGGALGKAAPVALGVETEVVQPPGTLREVFLGASKSLRRADFTLVGDYLDLASRRQVTVTLSCILHLRVPAQTK